MKKRRNEKREVATHQISEQERVQNIIQAASNPEKSVHKLKYNKKPRRLRVPSNIGETTGIRIDRKDAIID